MSFVGNDSLRIKYFIYCLFHRDGYDHAKWLKKHSAFFSIGENCFYQPYNLPQDTKLVRMGDNVVVASNVSFISHDVVHHIFNHETWGGTNIHKYTGFRGVIDIESNVFIGANSTILPNVQIGSNVIVAAGSVVASNIAPGSVAGGVPAKCIGGYEELKKKRQLWDEQHSDLAGDKLIDVLWNNFE